ncbi:MAG TPA: class I SAM-dependent rRNA methyltransferase, partial [Polyangia bacterium]|nr:class I SAM-dependent rRNA methyltransferase [Polyangia bacterium]
MPRVQLRKRLARAIRQGHPWLYRDALAGAPPLRDGALVLVVDADRRPLARGFWDARSPIAVRVLGGAEMTDPAAEIDGRIDRALAARLAQLQLDRTNAFRWIHGEADALPGLHVDVYGAAVTVRYDGGGA